MIKVRPRKRHKCNVKFLVSMTLGTIGSAVLAPAQNQLASSYTDPNYLLAQPGVSHWVYPSRAYLTTVPASQFINGIGINFGYNGPNNADVVAQMLAKYGFKHIRIEIDWGELDYNTGSSISSASILNRLTASQKSGLRPLIVLNANQANPCPHTQTVSHTVNVDALKGATTVQIKPGEDISDIKVGYSGISSPTLPGYIMNGVLVTAKDSTTNTITLSQPLPIALPAATPMYMNTFKYRPFDSPKDPYYNATEQTATLKGWSHYVKQIATIVSQYMGTTSGSADMGFDLEIWNELTFGSQFLILPLYYNDLTTSYSLTDVENILVNKTASTFAANPSLFAGVVLEDGFANEDPYRAASLEPVRVGALGKHPYPVVATYPASQTDASAMLNALFFLGTPPPGDWDLPISNKSPYFSFVPSYSEYMPEYYGTMLQIESIVRDLAPFNNNIGSVAHGENSRTNSNGNVVPCTVFITEIGIAPDQLNPTVTDQATALLMKAKGESRALAFYLNKGASQVDLFADFGGEAEPKNVYPDTDWGVLSDNFYNYVLNPNSNPAYGTVFYPADDTHYLTPAVTLIYYMVQKMKDQLDPSINSSNTRALTVNSISDTHNNYQFQGDGTPAHPPGYDREVFQFLPYQVNAHRFVIPFYVMTRNIAQPLTPEAFTIDVSGINGVGATFTVFDPLNNTTVPLTVNSSAANEVNLSLTAADYPYLLIVQETTN
jgi:hypothetical protein